MAVELTVRFFGLHAIVPSSIVPNSSMPNAPKSARILLPDARGRRRASDGVILEHHVACLEFDPQQWQLHQVVKPGEPPVVSQGDIKIERGVVGAMKTVDLVLLGREDLALAFDPADSQRFQIESVDQPYLNLDMCVQGAGEIAPACLGATPPATVGARFRLQHGILKPDPNGKDQDYTVAALGPSQPITTLPHKRMGERSVWSLTSQSAVTLLASDGGKEIWRLKPQKPAVELTVWNLEWGFIKDPSAKREEGTPDRDFVTYYALCDQSASISEPKVPTVKDTPAGGGLAKCMAAMFNASPDA